MGRKRQSPAVLWVLVTCASVEEATTIGEAVLAARRAVCFDIFPRLLTRYFWPPRKGKVQEGRGALLVLETLDGFFEVVAEQVRALHSDELPFVGALKVECVSAPYLEWAAGELRGTGPFA